MRGENIYVIGVPCTGKTDGETLKALGLKGILGVKDAGDSFTVETLYGEKTVSKQEALPERCRSCKSHKHMVYDELLGEEGRGAGQPSLRHGGEDRKHERRRALCLLAGRIEPLHSLQRVPQRMPGLHLREVRVR